MPAASKNMLSLNKLPSLTEESHTDDEQHDNDRHNDIIFLFESPIPVKKIVKLFTF